MSRGIPFQPGNNLGRGRPKGSRNKSTTAAQHLLGKFSEGIMRACIGAALEGDMRAIRLCFDHAPALRRPPAHRMKMPPITTASDIAGALDEVLKAVANGKCTAADGQMLASMLEGRRRVMETQDLAIRLQELEQRWREVES